MYTPVNQMYPHVEQGQAIGQRATLMNSPQQPRPESQMSAAINEAERAAGALHEMIEQLTGTMRDALVPSGPDKCAEATCGQPLKNTPSEMRGRIERVTATINTGTERLRDLRDRLEL